MPNVFHNQPQSADLLVELGHIRALRTARNALSEQESRATLNGRVLPDADFSGFDERTGTWNSDYIMYSRYIRELLELSHRPFMIAWTGLCDDIKTEVACLSAYDRLVLTQNLPSIGAYSGYVIIAGPAEASVLLKHFSGLLSVRLTAMLALPRSVAEKMHWAAQGPAWDYDACRERLKGLRLLETPEKVVGINRRLGFLELPLATQPARQSRRK